MEDDKLIMSKVMDKVKLHQKTGKVTNTNMLDPVEFSKVLSVLKNIDYIAFGGYELAERKVVFLSSEDVNFDDYITLIRITSVKELSHRSVLGSILGLGIKREMVGDIIINGNQCDVIVLKEISNFILQNLERVGREKVEVTINKLADILEKKDNSKMITITVASSRIDAVISACFGLSREVSAELIRRDKVLLNHVVINAVSKQIKEADIISVRGYGRLRLDEILGETRKNRTKILVCKY